MSEALAAQDLLAEIERQRQVIARLSAPGIGRAPWFYAPCSSCGSIEGMGLVTPKRDGELLKGHTSVWCANCGHYGPPVPNAYPVTVRTPPTTVEDSDRAATMAWNREFRETFKRLRAARPALLDALNEILCWVGPRSAASMGCKCETLNDAMEQCRWAIVKAQDPEDK